jgi:hypothetical protein
MLVFSGSVPSTIGGTITDRSASDSQFEMSVRRIFWRRAVSSGCEKAG